MSNAEVMDGEKTDAFDSQEELPEYPNECPQEEINNDVGECHETNGVLEDAANSSGGDDHSELALLDLPKHPLQYRWVLWYCKPQRGVTWENSMKKVITFDTVEDFWAMYHHVQPATGLSPGSDYYMFKEGIEPMWEDPHNCQGGRWLITVDRNRRDALLDRYWLELLMAIIGEQFDSYGDHISGTVVNIRQKGDKVSLWTSDASNAEVNMRIGEILKQKLAIPELITYELHQDTKQKTGSQVKPRMKI